MFRLRWILFAYRQFGILISLSLYFFSSSFYFILTCQTTLIVKKEATWNPSNYRPITCLSIMYKILSSIVTSRMSHHADANKIILSKQNGNASNTYGTIDQLIINKMVMDNVKLKQRNISAAWIDYKIAFDSDPHDWIIETLKIHKFDPITTKFIRKTMNNWEMSLYLNHQDGKIKTDHFSIITGIWQGDSPSGLLSLGYWTQATLDIKLIAKVTLFHTSYSWTILNSLLQTTINLYQW